MYIFIKKIAKNIFKFFGLEVKRYYPELDQMSFDQMYSEILKGEIIVFDVGANKGQTIERFNKLFNNMNIHSFEPIKFEFLNLKKKYSGENKIHLNNFALGNIEEEKDFHVNHYTGSSSFLKTTNNTDWLKLRSKQFKINPEEFLKNKEKIKINTLDNYCLEKKIDKIDIVKIDTQGYEDKVLEGCKKMIKMKKIKFIEIEIIFSDIYEKTLTIGEIENKLENNYRLFANDYYGNLYSNMVYQLNLIYISNDFFYKIKKNKEYKKN
tara:strand:+ start:107 stop:904 length:798 start_codon:yes stop_codon:yes gene_type:complete